MADTATEKVEDVAEEGKEKVSGNGSGHNGLAKKLLIPAAGAVGTAAVGYAAKKVPDLLRDQLMPKLEDRGSDEAAKMGKQAVDKMKDQSGIAGKVAGSVAGKIGGGGNGDGGGKKTRRLPIQRYTDVAVPVEVAYKAWTQFDKFPNFMHRVQSVEKTGNDEVQWEEKIWFSKRQWKGKITERRKNDRIAWKTTSGTQHTGIVSFHKIGDNLTRVMVTVDFHPTGMIEKMGSGLRFVKRAVQADLARFKTYVEMKDAKSLKYGNEKGDDDPSDDNGSSGKSNGPAKSSSDSEQDRKQRAERRKQRQA
jgi:carbon monoxide dehydrogenase subunit G